MSLDPIRLDEWMAELSRLEREVRTPKSGPTGFTTGDVGRITGCSITSARDRIRAWVSAGLVEYVGRRPQQAMDGRQAWAPVYMVHRGRRKGK